MADSAVPRNLLSSYRDLPAYNFREVRDIASLLEYFVQYMLQNHLIQVRQVGWAERLKEHIREHASDDLTVGRLADAVGLSPSFISHRFKQETGLSPRKFVLKERMKRAEEMLLQGHSVKEVGLQLGFCDEFHFSRAFKSWHGASPSAWTRTQSAGIQPIIPATSVIQTQEMGVAPAYTQDCCIDSVRITGRLRGARRAPPR